MKLCPLCRNTYPDDYQTCPRDQASLTATLNEITTGTVLRGKYEVLGELGAGGMATVYKVRHKAFQELAAVKVVHQHFMHDPGFVKRFRNEAVVARQLKHPNAVRIDDFDYTEDGRPFIVMEYVEGRSLYEARKEYGGAWGVEHCVNIVMQAASALGAAHTLGIVHRDIKPSNILLLRSDDGSLQVKVLDFGIAKVSDNPFAGMTSVNTQQSMIIGTPEYMSPEQAGGRLENTVDGRADLYSLGLVFYEMLTGAHPFKADTPMGMLIQQVHTAPAPPNSFSTPVSPAISALVLKCLQKDPDDRFQTAGDLLAAMRDPEAWYSTQVKPAPSQSQKAASTVPSAFMPLAVPAVRTEHGAQTLAEDQVAAPQSLPAKTQSKTKRYAVLIACAILAAAMLSAAGVYLRHTAAAPSAKAARPVAPTIQPVQAFQAPSLPAVPILSQTPAPSSLRSRAAQAPQPAASSVHPPQTTEPIADTATSARVKELIASGNRSLENGRYLAAGVVFQGALSLDPKNAEAVEGLKQARAGQASQGGAQASPPMSVASNSEPVATTAPARNSVGTAGGNLHILLSVVHFNGQVATGSQYTGPCPVRLQFGWFVIGAQPGVVTYHIIRQDGSQVGAVRTATLQQANRPLPIYENWTLGANTPQFASYSGWMELNIDAPSQAAKKIEFTIHCQ